MEKFFLCVAKSIDSRKNMQVDKSPLQKIYFSDWNNARELCLAPGGYFNVK